MKKHQFSRARADCISREFGDEVLVYDLQRNIGHCLNSTEESSGGRRRLGGISKQGNTMVRWLLVEAVHHAVRQDPELRQDYQRLKFRRGHAVAKVAIARKLAVRMYWMLRSGADYARLVRRQGSPGDTLINASSSLA
jgi:hypothetical protein